MADNEIEDFSVDEVTVTDFLPGRIDLKEEQLQLLELACERDREAREEIRCRLETAPIKLRRFLEKKLNWIYHPSPKPMVH